MKIFEVRVKICEDDETSLERLNFSDDCIWVYASNEEEVRMYCEDEGIDDITQVIETEIEPNGESDHLMKLSGIDVVIHPEEVARKL